MTDSTLDGQGEIVGDRTVRIERLLPGTPDRIWSYLTDSAMRREWLAVGTMEPRVGGRVEHLFRHHELSSEPTPDRYKAMAGSPAMLGEITQWDPPRLLAYTWPGDNGLSEVSFELFAEAGNVRLVVIHRQLADSETMVSVAAGWDAHLGVLIDRLAGDTPRGFWSTHGRLEAAYRERMYLLRDPPAEAEHFVRLQRIVDASPQAVYEAWTRLDLMNRWLGRVQADVRVGGGYRIESDGDEGEVWVHSGRYLALEPHRLVRQTFSVAADDPSPYLDEFIAVALHDLSSGCTLMDFFNGWHGEATNDEGRELSRRGWSMWFDLLDDFFEKDPTVRRTS